MDDLYDFFEKQENTTSIPTEFLINFHDLSPFYASIFIVSLITNGALLFVLRKTNVREAPNTFILSMALADLIVVLFVLPVSAAAYAKSSYQFHVIVCKTSEGLYEMSSALSAFSLPALTAYCFLDGREVTLPSGKSNWNVAVGIVWALAVVFSVPTTISSVIDYIEQGSSPIVTCLPNELMFLENWVQCRFAVYVATPLAAVGCFYCVGRRNETADERPSEQRDFSRVALVLVFVYAICLASGYVIDLWILDRIESADHFWHYLSLTAYCLTFVYRCLNPIALYFASNTFRRLFDAHLFFKCASSYRDQEPVSEVRLRDCEQDSVSD